MTVLELMQYLQGLCFEGKGQYMVKAGDDPFESKVFYVAPFSTRDDPDGGGTITLANRDRPLAEDPA